jgi:hypothetical protein
LVLVVAKQAVMMLREVLGTVGSLAAVCELVAAVVRA